VPKKKFKPLVLKPNPVRQAILVGLALAGIGVGYGLGYLLKENEPPSAPPAASASPSNPQQARPEPQPPEAPKPVIPVADPILPQNQTRDDIARAYEEALPKGIVEFPALTVPPRTDSLPNKPTIEPPGLSRPIVNAQIANPDASPPVSAKVETAAELLAEKKTPYSNPEVQIDNETMAGQFLHQDALVEPMKNLAPAPALLTGWTKHALAVELTDKPKIAIVIDDMGVDRRRSRLTIALQGPLTLSYLTYADQLAEQTRSAKQAGHELMLHVPMEPSSKEIDPGPNVLLSGVPTDEIRAALMWGLDQFDGFVGINNHMGSRFTSDLEGMKVVMQELRNRELIFLDSVTSGSTMGQLAARQIGVPFIARNIFLDHVDDIDQVRKRLNEVKRLARKQGFAVAIGHPRDATLQALRPWLETIEDEGFQLVPISALIRLATMHDTAPAITQNKEAN